MSRNFEALEADFQGAYGIDLRRALWGPEPMGLRRVLGLFRSLPPRSAFTRRQNDGQEWTNTDELLAGIAELIDMGNRMYFHAHVKKGKKSWKPLQLVRPGGREKRKARRKTLRQFFDPSTVKVGPPRKTAEGPDNGEVK